MELTTETYKLVNNYPKEEMFALTNQTKRAAVSVSSNIVEGIGRQFKKETIHFLHIAQGSLYELETQFHIGFRLGFIQEEKLDTIIVLHKKNLQVLNGLINYYKTTSLA